MSTKSFELSISFGIYFSTKLYPSSFCFIVNRFHTNTHILWIVYFLYPCKKVGFVLAFLVVVSLACVRLGTSARSVLVIVQLK